MEKKFLFAILCSYMKNRLKIILSFIILSLVIDIPQKSFNLNASSRNLENSNAELLDKDLYILGPGDLLFINFLGLPELSGNFKIMRDGNLQLPLVGSQNFTGLTLDNGIKKLTNLYENELISPQFDIQLLEARSLRISVIGEIKRPGTYSLDTGDSLGSFSNISNNVNYNLKGFPTVVDAIQKAGGLTFDSDITKVFIYRNLPGNNNELKRAQLNLLDLIKTGSQANNPILFDGDVIEISTIDYNEKNIVNIPTNLIPDKIKLYVIGEVEVPGMYEVAANSEISQVVLIAGGPKNLTSKNKIEHLRINRNGSVEVNKVSLKRKGLTNKNKKLYLRDGDIIKVNKNLYGKTTNVLSGLASPLGDVFSFYSLYKILED